MNAYHKNTLAHLIFLTVFVFVLFPTNSEAIPAFARKTNMACSTCHTAWPALNAFGRQYKEHGYRLGHLEAPNKTISKDLKWNESLPISVLLVARPYDKKKSGKRKIRALHEVELMVGGPMGDKMSGFFEIEAEDEVTNDIGFDTGISSAALTYNAGEAAHLQVSWGSITWFDPYNSYSNHLRMTRGATGVIDQSFGGADNGGKIKSARQNMAVYGRPSPNFFYGIGVSGDASDNEGVDGNTVTLRVAYDVMPALTVGALSVSGTCVGKGVTTPASTCVVDRKYSRTAFDIQSEFSNFTINAVALTAKDDDVTATANEKNNAFYIQAMYTVKEGARTTWAPVARYDSYEKTGGAEKVNEMTLSVNYYVTENIRSMFEFWSKDSNINAEDDDRLTLQFFSAF
jgi:hypothetical protein